MKIIDVPSQEDQGTLNRAVGGPENPRMPLIFGGHNLPPLVEIGLTDLPKSGDAMTPPVPSGTTSLNEHDHASSRPILDFSGKRK